MPIRQDQHGVGSFIQQINQEYRRIYNVTQDLLVDKTTKIEVNPDAIPATALDDAYLIAQAKMQERVTYQSGFAGADSLGDYGYINDDVGFASSPSDFVIDIDTQPQGLAVDPIDGGLWFSFNNEFHKYSRDGSQAIFTEIEGIDGSIFIDMGYQLWAVRSDIDTIFSHLWDSNNEEWDSPAGQPQIDISGTAKNVTGITQMRNGDFLLSATDGTDTDILLVERSDLNTIHNLFTISGISTYDIGFDPLTERFVLQDSDDVTAYVYDPLGNQRDDSADIASGRDTPVCVDILDGSWWMTYYDSGNQQIQVEQGGPFSPLSGRTVDVNGTPVVVLDHFDISDEWRDVTGNRSGGTSYSTGRFAREVWIRYDADAATSGVDISLGLSTTDLKGDFLDFDYDRFADGGEALIINQEIPSWTEYIIFEAGDTADYGIADWYERTLVSNS